MKTTCKYENIKNITDKDIDNIAFKIYSKQLEEMEDSEKETFFGEQSAELFNRIEKQVRSDIKKEQRYIESKLGKKVERNIEVSKNGENFTRIDDATTELEIVGFKKLYDGSIELQYKTPKKNELRKAYLTTPYGSNSKTYYSSAYKNGKSFKRVKYIFPDNVVENDEFGMIFYQASKEDREAIKNIKKWEEQSHKLLENTDMLLSFAKDLNLKSSVKAEPEHEKHLFDILKMIMDGNGKNIPSELKIYLKEMKTASSGQFFPHGINSEGEHAGIYVKYGTNEKRLSKYQQSPFEKFVHELDHAAMYYAINSKDPSLGYQLTRLRKIHRDFVDNHTWKDLLPDNYTKQDEKIAQDIFDHIQGKNGFHEFLTLGKTNKMLMNTLKKEKVYDVKRKKSETIFEALKNFLKDVINSMLGVIRKENKTTSAYNLLMKYSVDIMEANNRAVVELKKAETENFIEKNLDQINTWIKENIIEKIGKEIEEKSKGMSIEKYDPSWNKAQKAIWLFKSLAKSIGDENYRPHLENMLNSLPGKWFFGHEGFFQDVLKDFRAKDSLMQAVENLGLLLNKLDQDKYTLSTYIKKNILTMFNGKIEPVESESLTKTILETDLQSLGSSIDKIKTLFSSDVELEAEINKQKEIIRSKIKKDEANFMINQARGLGNFMITGQDNRLLLKNAERIANQFSFADSKDKQSKTLINAIDKLATLEAIKLISKEDKDIFIKISNSNPGSIKSLINMHKSFVLESKRTLFERENDNYIKGYIANIYDDSLDIKFAPLKDRKKLEEEGYSFVQEATRIQNEKMGVFVSNFPVRTEYLKHALSLTNPSASGTTIEKSLFNRTKIEKAEDVERVKFAAKLITKKLREKDLGELKNIYKDENYVFKNQAMGAIYDKEGRVKTFNFQLEKEAKRKMLNQDKRIENVLGKMFASSLDKVRSSKHNREVVEVMINDVEENYDKHTGMGKVGHYKDYVWISPESDNEEHRERWFLLPDETRKYIELRTEELKLKGILPNDSRGIPVRADLAHYYFGKRKFSLEQFDFLKNSTGPYVKSILNKFNQMWTSAGSIQKVNIVIKTPAVWVGDILSSELMSYQLGVKTPDLVKLKRHAWSVVDDYKKVEEELIKTKVELNTLKGQDGKKAEMLKKKIEMLNDELEHNAAYPLISRGLFPAILDDAKTDDVKQQNLIAKKIDEYLDKLPPWASNIANWLYISERTALYQLALRSRLKVEYIQKFIMFSSLKEQALKDFIKKNKRRPNSEELEAIEGRVADYVKDAFINYNAPRSKVEQYLNDTMLMPFTVFYKKIQKVINAGIKDKPLNFIISRIFENTIMDVDDITEHSVFIHSPNFGTPIDTLEEIFYPKLLESDDLISRAFSSVKVNLF